MYAQLMVFKKIPLLRRMENAHYSTSDLKYIYLPTAKEKEDHPKKILPNPLMHNIPKWSDTL